MEVRVGNFTFHLIYLQRFQISFPLKYQLHALFSGIHSSAWRLRFTVASLTLDREKSSSFLRATPCFAPHPSRVLPIYCDSKAKKGVLGSEIIKYRKGRSTMAQHGVSRKYQSPFYNHHIFQNMSTEPKHQLRTSETQRQTQIPNTNDFIDSPRGSDFQNQFTAYLQLLKLQ